MLNKNDSNQLPIVVSRLVAPRKKKHKKNLPRNPFKMIKYHFEWR